MNGTVMAAPVWTRKSKYHFFGALEYRRDLRSLYPEKYGNGDLLGKGFLYDVGSLRKAS